MRKMARIFWDTNIFIYLFEDAGPLGKQARTLRIKMLQRNDQLLTSWMTVAEIQIQPLKSGAVDKAAAFQSAIKRSASLIAFDESCSKSFLDVRLNSLTKGPDAIQLACASAMKVDLFITNDDKLVGLQIPGIQFITKMDRVPF